MVKMSGRMSGKCPDGVDGQDRGIQRDVQKIYIHMASFPFVYFALYLSDHEIAKSFSDAVCHSKVLMHLSGHCTIGN